MKTIDDWRKALDKRECVGAVFVDLSKAFDTIDHGLLLQKLLCYGVKGKEYQWFSNYLKGRKQRVALDDTMSRWVEVVRGVPQGSVLGPLLFIVYINDLPGMTSKCNINMYADDVAIYCSGKDINEVTTSLNSDLAEVVRWTECNHLKINVSKTQYMVLGNKAMRSGQDVHLRLPDEIVPSVSFVKYLGLLIDDDLSWKSHILAIRKKAFAAISSIRQVSRYLSVDTRKLLYNTLVLPHLQYCSTVWLPCSQALSLRLERVQNYSMRVILNQPPRTPSAFLRKQLNWTTLAQRRQNHMLSQVHRCLIGRAPQYLRDKFVRNSCFYSSTRGNLHIPQPRTNMLKYSFEYQGVFHYNKLPYEIKEKSDVFSFKRALRLKTLDENNFV